MVDAGHSSIKFFDSEFRIRGPLLRRGELTVILGGSRRYWVCKDDMDAASLRTVVDRSERGRTLQSGHFLPGATGEWCHGSEQRRCLGGNRKDGHLGEQSGNGAGREPPLRGREMGRAEWERRVGGGGLCKRGRAESESRGAGRGRERTPNRGESRVGQGVGVVIHGNTSVSEKSGFWRVSSFAIIIQIVLSA